MTRNVDRRQFLVQSAAAGVGLVLGGSLAGARTVSPNAKLQHACIGVGSMGWNDLHSFANHKRVQIVALCDVDADNLARAAQVAPDARLYADWRELLEKEDGRIDAVNVAVPDHMHFSIAWSAIEKGKHVYCQKPMCHDVAEVRALTQASVKNNVITQLGTQFASTVHERTAVLWLREGRIGKVTHAYLCSNRPGAVENYRLKGPRPPTGEPPPKNLNWELWSGCAPLRAYVRDIYHPVKWRAWQDFGTGWSGDIGCHIFDPVWKGLGLQPPTSVCAEVQESWKDSPERRGDTWPQGEHITWTFPANHMIEGNELVLEWFDGEYYPPQSIRKLYSGDLKDYPAESSMLVGTEGALFIPLGAEPELLPDEKFTQVRRPNLPERDHYHRFVEACLGGEKTESHFAQTGPMTEAILLGTVAIRAPGAVLRWEARRLRIPNHPEAEQLLRRDYRKGWELPVKL